MTAPAAARESFWSVMRTRQILAIDSAAAALSAVVDELEDCGLMADAATVRVAVDGLYRTRAKLADLLRRAGEPVPPIPNDVVAESDAIDGVCPGCGASLGSEHKRGCAL